MVMVYLVAAIIGGTATVSLVGQYSFLLGLLAAPFGASLLALATALVLATVPLALRRSSKTQAIPPDVIWR
jgi:hypothetical protein